MGIQMASAYVGSTLMPPVFGLVSKWLGLSFFPVYLGLLLILMIFCTEWIKHRYEKRIQE